MISDALRAVHAPVWLVFAVVFGLYFATAGWWMLNGFTRELFGSTMPHMGRIHIVVYNFHTGLPVSRKSHGDEKRLRRANVNTQRTTPEGLMVYFSPLKRWQRALRNNGLILAWLLATCGMAIDPVDTVRAVTLAVMALTAYWVYSLIHRARERHRKSHPISRPAMARTQKARLVLSADELTVDDKPKLEEETRPALEGVPQTVLAGLLSSRLGISTEEVLRRLDMSTERGVLLLPDTYAALEKERESIQEIISAQTKGKVRFTWTTHETPRRLEWLPIVEARLPSKVRFRDYLDQIEALGPREFGVGVNAARNMYTTTHNGDAGPWQCRFAGPGTGKSTGFLVKAAQIAHKDPTADLYCVDTKQVSFEYLRDIPGIHILDDPQSNMGKIWDHFYKLAEIMDDRYTAVREGRCRYDDFNDIWSLTDEGNDLAAQLKSYSRNVKGNTSAGAPIWGEAIARIFRMGRQCHIYGEWMFQDLDGRMFAGETLKTAFSVYGAAGFTSGQFGRVMGPPSEECIDGVGKILMCRGRKREWIQGFYDDENWLHEYALENRKELAA